MAGKGWTTQVAAAAGVAAGTGAAQLGLGYGLGVVVWPVTPTADDSIWLGSLGWATWIAASATVFGAVIAARLRGSEAPRPGGPWRFVLAASAAVGALLTVVLVAVPARAPTNSTVRADTFAPEVIAGGYAVVGVVLGLVIAYWAVVSRAVAANLIATAGYLWALAAASIVVELTLHRESATYLTSWQFAELGTQARYGTIYWPSALLTLLAALIVGLIAAWPSVRNGNLGVGTASSGAVGPLLVAASFLALAPQLTGALGQLESAYLIAPYAVLAGLAGSALIVAAGRRSAQRRAARIARIHQPSPPAATGKATVPAHPDSIHSDEARFNSTLDTPPTGTPQVSAATPTQRSGRAKPSTAPRPAGPARASAARQARASQAGASQAGASQTAGLGSADEDQATARSDRPSRWSWLRRGGREKASTAASAAEVTTNLDPEPTSSTSQVDEPRTDSPGSSASGSRTGATRAGASGSGATRTGASRADTTQPSTSGSSPTRTGASRADTNQPGANRAGASRAGASRAGSSGAGAGAGAAAPASSRASKPPAASPGSAPPPASAAPTTPPKARPAAKPTGPASADNRATDSAEPKTPPRTARSTVAAPPPAPPIAKINPPRDAAAEPGSNPSRPSPSSAPTKATPPRTTPPKPKPDPTP